MVKINVDKEWCEKMARLEGDCEIGAGSTPASTNNIKWWIARILFFRWLTGCGGEGFWQDKGGAWHICNRLGCH